MREDVLEIIWQDDAFVAVNKPAGLLVHRSPLDPSEERFALQLVRNILGRRVYPVHRLDRPTSGVLLFALSPEGAQQLSAAFAERRVGKHYLAVVRGVMADEGVIVHPLADLPDRYLSSRQPNRPKRAAKAPPGGAITVTSSPVEGWGKVSSTA